MENNNLKEFNFYQNSHSKTNLVLFIHGFTGNAEATWVNPNGTNFPSLLLEDKYISDNFDLATYNYQSCFSNTYLTIKNIKNILTNSLKAKTYKNIGISELAQNLRDSLKYKLHQYNNVFVISHSMGGLITKKAIIDDLNKNSNSKIKLYLSLAVPHQGSDWGPLAASFSKNQQLRDLCPTKELITSLNQAWMKLSNKPMSKYFYGSFDNVVTKHSAVPVDAEEEHIISSSEDHSSICKPVDNGSLIYIASCKFIKTEHQKICTEGNGNTSNKVNGTKSPSIDNIVIRKSIEDLIVPVSEKLPCTLISIAKNSESEYLAKCLRGVFGIFVELDFNSGIYAINKNQLLIDIAQSIYQQSSTQCDNSFDFANYKSALALIKQVQTTVKSFMGNSFNYGTADSLICGLESFAKQTNPLGNTDHNLFSIEDLYYRLVSNSVELSSILNCGHNLLKALLEDISTLAQVTKQKFCIYLANQVEFPEYLYTQLIKIVEETNYEVDMTMFISKFTEVKSNLPWPSTFPFQSISYQSSVRENDDKSLNTNLICNVMGYQSSYLNELNLIFPDKDYKDLIIQFVSVTGSYNNSFLKSYLNISEEEAIQIEHVWLRYFDGLTTPPITWRKIILQRIESSMPHEAFLNKADSTFNQLNRQEEISYCKFCLYGYYKTRSTAYLAYITTTLMIDRNLHLIAEFLQELSLLSLTSYRLEGANVENITLTTKVLSGLLKSDTDTLVLRRAYLASVLQDHEEHYSEQSLSEIYYQLAFIDYSMKSYQKARDNIECSLVLNESNYKSYNLDALVYFAEGNIPKAIKQVASSININNGYAYSHYNMGVIWESQNKHAKAANAYIKCLILEPEFYEALFNLSNILLDLNCYEDAGIIASYGATISPAFEAEICSNIAISLLNSGHSQQGLKILLGLASHNNAQYIFYNIAFTYYSRGQLETAQDWLDKINSEKISPELSISVIQLRKNIKQNKIEHFDISEETPNTAKKLGIKIDFLYSYLEENGFRRNIKFEKIVHHATHSQPISPLKFCPKSSQQQTKKSKNSKRQLNNAPKREPALPLTQSKVPKVKRIKRKNNLRHHRLPSYSGG